MRVTAWLIVVATLGLWAAGAAAIVSRLDEPAPNSFGTPYGDLVLSVALLAFTLAGVLVVRAQPGNRVGWLLLAAGLVVQLMGTTDEPGLTAISNRAAAAFIATVSPGLALTFPDGRLPSRHWRWWAMFGGVVAVGVIASAWVPALLLLLAVGLGSLAAPVVRYRRGDRVTRQQVRGAAVALGLSVITFVLVLALGEALPRPTPTWFRVLVDGTNLAFAAVPLAIGVAVLRFRLWLVDLVAHRALITLGVAVFTGAVYVAVVVGLGSALGHGSSPWLLLIATAAVALGVDPVRKWSRGVAHRLVYADPNDPYAAINAFAERVGDAALARRVEEISRHADELRESRRRLVTAEDTARRRIERDLHDGAQLRLVTLSLQLQRIRGRARSSPELVGLLDDASQDLRHALAELRELARGISPSLLVESGLGPAVSALVERAAADARLTECPDRRYPAAVESTAYFVVAEGLTNAAKHAAGARVTVSVQETGGRLIVSVFDDGPGGASTEGGSGLSGLRDRVSAVGGRFQVRSGDGGWGTILRADLPLTDPGSLP